MTQLTGICVPARVSKYLQRNNYTRVDHPSFLPLVGGRSNREGWSGPEKVDHPFSSPFPLSPLLPPLAFVAFVPLLISPSHESPLAWDEEVIRQAARNDTSFVIAFFDGRSFSFFFFFYLRPRNKFGNKLREAQLACLSRWRAVTFEEAEEGRDEPLATV